MSMASPWQVSHPTIIPLCSVSTHRPVAGHDVAAPGNSYRDFHLSHSNFIAAYCGVNLAVVQSFRIFLGIFRSWTYYFTSESTNDKAETIIGCALRSLLSPTEQHAYAISPVLRQGDACGRLFLEILGIKVKGTCIRQSYTVVWRLR
jgi:hypothetical protein